MLLGLPGSSVAAVIVEANRFAYIYHSTPPSQAHGSHQAISALPEPTLLHCPEQPMIPHICFSDNAFRGCRMYSSSIWLAKRKTQNPHHPPHRTTIDGCITILS